MKDLIHRMLCLCVLAGLTGCAGQTYYADLAQSESMTFASADVPATMAAAEKILGQMHFTVRQMDRSTGALATNPLPGAQFFEFWRKDAANRTRLAESSLHSIRRSVILEFFEEDTGTSAQCQVLTERLSVPNRQVAGHSRAYGVLTESSASMPTMRLSESQKDNMTWIPLGHDPDLAQLILFHIETELTAFASSQ